MATTVKIEVEGRTAFLELSKSGKIKVYDAVKASDFHPVIEALRSNGKLRDKVYVRAFLADTDSRPHHQVAKDLETVAEHVRMMRYQWKVEKREPSEKRLEILRKFYKLPI